MVVKAKSDIKPGTVWEHIRQGYRSRVLECGLGSVTYRRMRAPRTRFQLTYAEFFKAYKPVSGQWIRD